MRRVVPLVALLLLALCAGGASAAPTRTTAQLSGDSLGRIPRHEQPEEHEEEPPEKGQAPGSPRAADLTTSSAHGIRENAVSSSTNFDGPDLTDSGAYPPDSMGAVGPTQFVAMINGRVRSYSKATGAPDGVLNADTDVFWASAMTPVDGATVTSNFTSDPHIRYDRATDRWFAVMIDVPNDGKTANRIMVAVSSTGTITGATTWSYFWFSAPAGEFADYPTLGVDANALYIGTNDFNTTAPYNFVNTNGYVVRKSSILGAGPIVVTSFLHLIDGSGNGPYTPQGVDNPTPGATSGYFVGVDNNAFGQLDILTISNPGTTPTKSSTTVTVPRTQYPNSVPHASGSPALDAIDDRLFAAQIRNGHLWTAHNIGVTSSGTSPTLQAGVDRTATRWYDITLSSPSSPTTGTVYDASASSPRSYWMPSLAVNGQGTMTIGGSTAGASARPDAWYSSLPSGASAVATPTRYTSATASYNPPYDRWGDYSYTSVDPVDDQTTWTIQEYVSGTNVWGTRIVKLLAPAPEAPTSVSPADLVAGQASTPVTITGSTSAGWFDPGAGFTGRLSVAVTGCAATVNSFTLVSSRRIDLSLNTTGLTAGTCDVKVTNADGQSATATALLSTPGRPVASDDGGYSTAYQTALDGTGLLANDTDPQSDPLTAIKTTDPAHGTVTVAGDGSFHYTPAAGYSGSDSFTYQASDGTLRSLPATVSVSVGAAPAPDPTPTPSPSPSSSTPTPAPAVITPVVPPAPAPVPDPVPVSPVTPTVLPVPIIAPVSPATPTVRCVVPSLRGHSLAHARRALRTAHCTVGSIRRVTSARGVARGRIVSSSPPAGRRLLAGTPVKIVIRR